MRLSHTGLAPAPNLLVIPGVETLGLFGLGGWGRPGDPWLSSHRKSSTPSTFPPVAPHASSQLSRRVSIWWIPDGKKYWPHNPTWNSLRGELWMMTFEVSGRPFLPFPGYRSSSCLEVAGNRPRGVITSFQREEKRVAGRESSVLFRLILDKRCFYLCLQTGWIFPSVFLFALRGGA